MKRRSFLRCSGLGIGLLPVVSQAKPVTGEIGARTEQKEVADPGNTHEPEGNRDCLISEFTFRNFVEGKNSQLAKAVSLQVAKDPGGSFNPLFIYGGDGLGKTHLMHAVGNQMMAQKPGAKVVCLHSERFVTDMVRALQHNALNEFRRYYRSVDALFIDDIQFFAGRERAQQEFYFSFNALLEKERQVIVTCDRYPKLVDGFDEHLKSVLGWGLTVALEPPDLETRLAILKTKADKANVYLSDDVALFIGKHIRSNVRELEGVLRRVVANSQFTGRPITLEFTREVLKDLLVLQDPEMVENIQKAVAEYYRIRRTDLLSRRRNRSIARPRQVAMSIVKELTNHSLVDIGDRFGGREPATVLHGCKKIAELKEIDMGMKEDYRILLKILTT